jgi:hypothetical protein
MYQSKAEKIHIFAYTYRYLIWYIFFVLLVMLYWLGLCVLCTHIESRFCNSCNFSFNLIKSQYYKLTMSYAKQTNNNGYNYELFKSHPWTDIYTNPILEPYGHGLARLRKKFTVYLTKHHHHRYMDNRSKTELRGELLKLDKERIANSPVKSKVYWYKLILYSF